MKFKAHQNIMKLMVFFNKFLVKEINYRKIIFCFFSIRIISCKIKSYKRFYFKFTIMVLFMYLIRFWEAELLRVQFEYKSKCIHVKASN